MLLPIAQLTFLVSLVVLVPLAFIRRTRRFAGTGLFFGSFLFAFVTWLLAALTAFGAYGWGGLIIGLLIFGVGVIPIGIFAAFFSLHMTDLGISLVIMTGIAIAARFGGGFAIALADSEKDNE